MGIWSRSVSAWGFLRRHRIKLLILAGGAACAYTYFALRQKYLVVTRALEAERKNATTHLQEGFGVSLAQAHEVFKKMLPELQAIVFKRVDSDALVLSLKQNPPASERRQMWENLKIVSFVRPLTCLYALALLEMVLVTKFNLVGRYVSSNVTTAELPGGFLLTRTQQSYIGLTRQTLLGPGMDELANVVEAAVQEVIGAIELSQKMGSADVVLALVRVRRLVEVSSRTALRKILTRSCTDPDANLESWGDGENIAALLAEEMDILESSDASTVLGEVLDNVFEHFETLLCAEVGKEAVPLPKALPKIANLSTVVLGDPSPVVHAIEQTPLVKQFAAVVYLSGELPE